MQSYLYTFRRCPYAMRARLGLHLSTLNPEVREIILKDKPQHMLEISPKGTVPVLMNGDTLIEESLEILIYALTHYPSKQNPYFGEQAYQVLLTSLQDEEQHQLIRQHDTEFKPCLDKYKYADRFPERSMLDYRGDAEAFLQILENKLSINTYLFDGHITLADLAIFPFIRQFAGVDRPWFKQSQYKHLKHWLSSLTESQLFKHVMVKYPLWLDRQVRGEPRLYLK